MFSCKRPVNSVHITLIVKYRGCLHIFKTILLEVFLSKYFEKNWNNFLFEMKIIVCYFDIYSSFEMSCVNKLWIEEYIIALFEEGFSYFMIQKLWDGHGIKILICIISNIMNRKGKKPLIITST